MNDHGVPSDMTPEKIGEKLIDGYRPPGQQGTHPPATGRPTGPIENLLKPEAHRPTEMGSAEKALANLISGSGRD